MAASNLLTQSFGPPKQGVWSHAVAWLIGGGVLLAPHAQAELEVDFQQIDIRLAEPVDQIEKPADQEEGFTLELVDDDQRKTLNELTQLLDERDWANAFRMLTVLSEETLQAIAPKGDTRVYAPVRGQVQRRLMSLDPEGQRAFRLYFDAQANELFEQVKGHPLPGSFDAMTKLQVMLDRFYPTTIGGRAAVLAGDLYFERGMFVRAERSWRMAVEHDQLDGIERDGLQARRVLALLRAGDQVSAMRLFNELRGRYDTLPVRVGSEQVDGLAMLQQMLDPQAAGPVVDLDSTPIEPALPKQGSEPAWHLTFLDKASRSRGQSNNRYSYYRMPEDIKRFVPEVFADNDTVYFAWLDVVFALNRETGKIRWINGSMAEASKTMSSRMSYNSGDPRNYNISLAPDAVLVTRPFGTQNRSQAFRLVSLSKINGKVLWSSGERQDWLLTGNGDPNKPVSILGEITMVQNAAYAVIHRVGEADCYLRRFDPVTGRVDWTLSLGTAQPIGFGYNNQMTRMPQPIMLANNDLLHVLVGGGMLITIDAPAGKIAWALRMDTPLDVELANSSRSSYNSAVSQKIDQASNPNGSAGLMMRKGVLYAKQHLGRSLFAINPRSGQVAWSKRGVQADARLIGVDDKRVYLMDGVMRSYPMGSSESPEWDSSATAGRPQHAGAILGSERILLLDGAALRMLDSSKGKPVGAFVPKDVFEPRQLLSKSGGRLYRFDDLLVCIDQHQIAAFKLDPNENN